MKVYFCTFSRIFFILFNCTAVVDCQDRGYRYKLVATQSLRDSVLVPIPYTDQTDFIIFEDNGKNSQIRENIMRLVKFYFLSIKIRGNLFKLSRYIASKS